MKTIVNQQTASAIKKLGEKYHHRYNESFIVTALFVGEGEIAVDYKKADRPMVYDAPMYIVFWGDSDLDYRTLPPRTFEILYTLCEGSE